MCRKASRDLLVEREDALRPRPPAAAPPERMKVQRTDEALREVARLIVQALLRADPDEIERARDQALRDDPDALWVYSGGMLNRS